jgi:hypothetical protein
MGKNLKEEDMRVIEENKRYVICLPYPMLNLLGGIDGPKIIIKKEKKKRNIIVDFKEGAVSPAYIRMFIRDRKLSYRYYTKSCRIAGKYNKKGLQYLSYVGKFEKREIRAYERAIEISEAVYRGKAIEGGAIKKDTYLGQ